MLFAADGGPVSAAPADPTLIYQESAGKAVKHFQWRRASAAQEEVITVTEEDATFVNHCDRTGRTLAWHFRQGRQTEIQVTRDGNLLKIAGILQGNMIDTAASIDDRPWYQPERVSETLIIRCTRALSALEMFSDQVEGKR